MTNTRPAFSVVKLAALIVAVAVVVVAVGLPATAHAGPWGKLTTADGKTSFNLTKDTIVVGSSSRADVVFSHPTVASRHIRITHKSGIVQVTDLGSRTGTLVAGTELKKDRSMQIYQKTTLSLGALNVIFDWGDRGKLIQPLRKSKKAPKAAKSSKKGKKRKGATPSKRAKKGAKAPKSKTK